MFKAQGIGHRFGSRWLFRELEIELQPGMVLAILGRNGSGKSTLLRILARLLDPTEGRVVQTPAVGYAALDLALYPSLTGRQHVDLRAALAGTSAASGYLAEFDLARAEDQLVSEYSTGMRVRLKLALALLGKPPVLILDEPTASLDREGVSLIERIIQQQILGGAVLMATNDPDDLRHATHSLNLDEHASNTLS